MVLVRCYRLPVPATISAWTGRHQRARYVQRPSRAESVASAVAPARIATPTIASRTILPAAARAAKEAGGDGGAWTALRSLRLFAELGGDGLAPHGPGHEAVRPRSARLLESIGVRVAARSRWLRIALCQLACRGAQPLVCDVADDRVPRTSVGCNSRASDPVSRVRACSVMTAATARTALRRIRASPMHSRRRAGNPEGQKQQTRHQAGLLLELAAPDGFEPPNA